MSKNHTFSRSQILSAPPAALALLLHAISATEQHPGATELRVLVEGLQDWDTLLQLAARHHVSPLLYQALHRTDWEGVPPAVHVRLKMHFAANVKRNFRLAQHATGLLNAFNTAGVRVMPYKGVFIAASVYGHLSSREVSDIDLLIGADDLSAAREILLAANFEPIEKLEQQEVFRLAALQIDIDLHWQISPGFFPVAYDFQQLWRRSSPAQLGGVEYRALSPEDLLLLLCVQLAKDCWERRQRLVQLQKVCDVAAVIRHSPGLEWDALQQRAARQGLVRTLHFSLALAVGLLGARLPEAVAVGVDGDGVALSLARQVSALPELAETTVPPERNSLLDVRLRLRQLVFYVRLRERLRDKWLYPVSVMRALLAGHGRNSA